MERKELKIKLVFQANNKLKTDSLIVARIFEKEHKNVMRSIRNLECSDEFIQLNFELTDYIDKTRAFSIDTTQSTYTRLLTSTRTRMYCGD